MDVTGPYLGTCRPFPQMKVTHGPEDARRMVDYWADEGMTSFKAYMNITRAELQAAIDEAHKRGLKVTGHLARSPIRSCRHGHRRPGARLLVDTDSIPQGPRRLPGDAGRPTVSALTPDSPAGKALIADLVKRHVAVTSTLPCSSSRWPGVRRSTRA